MVIFHSYVKLPEGNRSFRLWNLSCMKIWLGNKRSNSGKTLVTPTYIMYILCWRAGSCKIFHWNNARNSRVLNSQSFCTITVLWSVTTAVPTSCKLADYSSNYSCMGVTSIYNIYNWMTLGYPHFRNPHIIYTLWLFNIAMENGTIAYL